MKQLDSVKHFLKVLPVLPVLPGILLGCDAKIEKIDSQRNETKTAIEKNQEPKDPEEEDFYIIPAEKLAVEMEHIKTNHFNSLKEGGSINE